MVVAPVAHADPQKASTAPTAIAPKVAKPNVSTASEKKAVAEANQIRIDTKLKKLLVLKNMKGELAHE